MIDNSPNPSHTIWAEGADTHPDFPIQNLLLSVFSQRGAHPRIGTAISDHILDYDLEMGVWMGPGNALGENIPVAAPADRIVGICLLNNWSARDIQVWEYKPLGPFLSKNYLTSISLWIITAEALAPFRMAQPARPERDPAPQLSLLDGDRLTLHRLAERVGYCQICFRRCNGSIQLVN